jgi:hypothetical protein
MYREMNEAIYGNCAGIQHPFSAYRNQLIGKPSTPFERAINVGLETIFGFNMYFVFLHGFCL